ncbi:carboxyl transferase domain-containing protein [Actinacidiphila sp. ITFR-21]|uniref:carboxyl transferase domain-containing protein n=1 Tax=Actinacidiphila sp. ITFR-21 TaxID=3075199 RepID=UPI00288A447D|nr:carboxyl transferase domain-containing protein [Streptomyces sp. ITFR-21]WNI18777.1 carboxyl transferase domain-containing protein [Streptomyces sp. ITFR-21]
MPLRSQVDTSSEIFRHNAEAFDHKRQVIAEARTSALGGGGEQARRRHAERGKLPARGRVHQLLDPGTPFLEIGQLAAHGVYDQPVPSAGLVTGVGVVGGRPAMIFANDATVKGGTYFPLTVKKHVRAQAIARENRLPCVYLVDSGGVYLPLQEDLFPDEHHLGRIFRNIAEMSALGLPQIAAVMGSCTAGAAYIPAMCDETVMVRGTGAVFLGGPQLVRAATGEVVDAETLGGADLHTRVTGVADHLAESDDHALALVRGIVARSSAPVVASPPERPRPPLFDPAELPGIVSAGLREHIPAREILARLLDGSELTEYRARFGPTMVCGTGHVGGYPVGVLVNDGVLFSESAQKAANFIELCAQRGLPLLFLHNINGFMVGAQYEAGGITKHGAKLVNAVATARVPKFSLVIGASFGAGNFAMCGRAMGPRLMAMWPSARSTVVGGEQTATVMALIRGDRLRKEGRTLSPEEERSIREPIVESYERQSQPLYYAARMWVDAVVDPTDTREWLTLCLALAGSAPAEETRFGVFRM